ncbi:MAG: hypothetical protein IPG91_18130 [Ideonella sp.]|nr:hypothetical protein [Ideonella sp.]
MAAFALKRYQGQALDALDNYLRAARLTGARAAFESETGYGYNAEPFGETPCVCLRIPTGGGRCVFAMLFKLENGPNVPQQIDAAIR